jgi:hypothetical protein
MDGDPKHANQLFGENSAEPWTARAYPIQLRQLEVLPMLIKTRSSTGKRLVERRELRGFSQAEHFGVRTCVGIEC